MKEPVTLPFYLWMLLTISIVVSLLMNLYLSIKYKQLIKQSIEIGTDAIETVNLNKELINYIKEQENGH